jgi:hypothetical protein
MKKLLLLLTLLPSLVFAQLTIINPDTVCQGAVSSIYQVPATVGLSYNWTVALPGVITSSPIPNQILVNWSNATPGLIPNGISVTATDIYGCQSLPVTLDVFIYNVNPVLTPLPDMCEGSNCVTLVATPTGGIWSGPGVLGNEFCPVNSGPPGIVDLTYTYTNAGCTFISVMSVNVLAQPMLLPIEHN